MPSIVTFGEVMLRLSPPGFQRFSQAHSFEASFGGGEANVAVSLAQLGAEAAFVTRLPENELAHTCVRELRGLGVRTEGIVYGGERMGIYFMENGAMVRGSRVLYDRSHSAMADIRPGMIPWDQVLAGAAWFHWSGITPALSQGAADACQEAIAAARRLGVKVSCDLNFRRKLWRYGRPASEVMPALVEGCDLILGNEEDAEMEFGIKPEGFDAARTGGNVDPGRFAQVCRLLMERFPRCRKVAITLRGSVSASHNTWGGVLYDGSTLWQSTRYDLAPMVDRVGGGDAFMAGLLYGLTYLDSDQEALDFAAAASALKHTIPGDYNRVSRDDVMQLLRAGGAGRVSR